MERHRGARRGDLEHREHRGAAVGAALDQSTDSNTRQRDLCALDAFLAAPPRDYSKGDCVQEGGSCEGSATPYAPFPHMPVCMHAAPPPRRKGPRLSNLKLMGGKEFCHVSPEQR